MQAGADSVSGAVACSGGRGNGGWGRFRDMRQKKKALWDQADRALT